jgi:hypothetical protein
MSSSGTSLAVDIDWARVLEILLLINAEKRTN